VVACRVIEVDATAPVIPVDLAWALLAWVGPVRDPAFLDSPEDGVDAVIAIAVTLLVLEIHPPEDSQDLLHGLATLWPPYLSYILTFMSIGQIWANHHVMFDHIRSVDCVVLFLNTVLHELFR
jgi:hypothetical protein